MHGLQNSCLSSLDEEYVTLQALPRYDVLCSACLQTMCDLTTHCLQERKLHILHSLFGRDHYSHYHRGLTIVTAGACNIWTSE